MEVTSTFNSLSISNSGPNLEDFAAKIGGNHTEFVVTHFANCTNIIVTQGGKIGNLFRVEIDQPVNGFTTGEPVYTISTLLGGENLEAEVAVRYLAEKLRIRKKLLLSLTLKNYSRSTIDAVLQTIQKHSRV